MSPHQKQAKSILLLNTFGGFIYQTRPKPHVVLKAHQQESRLFFEIDVTDDNGILGLSIWQPDTRMYYWQVTLNYYEGGELEYGVVPADFKRSNGRIGDATQEVPAGGVRPPDLPNNTRFIVGIDVQYDRGMAAMAESFFYSFSTDADGIISAVVPIKMPPPEELPK